MTCASSRSGSPTACSARVAEAEDVVQEALIRMQRPHAAGQRGGVPHDGHDAAVDRRAALRARAPRDLRRRVAAGAAGLRRGAGAVESEETISLAMLVLLERLAPDERAVFVLREAFDMPFAEIGEIIEPRPTPAGRSSAARARRIDKDAPALRPRSGRAPRARRTASCAPRARATSTGLRRAARPRRRPGRRRRRQGPLDPKPMVGAQPVARALASFYGSADELGVTLTGGRQRPARASARSRRRPARQRRRPRHRRRPDPAHPLDAQPGQARATSGWCRTSALRPATTPR